MTLTELFTESECSLFKSMISELQPRLEKFSSQPVFLALVWLVSS